MNDKDYTIAAKRTLSLQFNSDAVSANLIHCAIGAVTETAELLDAVKKTLFYGKTLDMVNVVEEVGDIMWYLAVLLDEIGVTFDDVKRINIAKLSTRYPQKFTGEAANVRDLAAERAALEQKIRGVDLFSTGDK